MNSKLGIFGMAAGIVIGLIVSASSVQAATKAVTSTITVSLGATNVQTGSTVKFSGKAGRGNTGNASHVQLWFRKNGTSAYQYMTIALVSPTGSYSQIVKLVNSGSWYFRYLGNSIRKPVSRAISSSVWKLATREVKGQPISQSYRGMLVQQKQDSWFTLPSGSGAIIYNWNYQVSWSAPCSTGLGVFLNGYDPANNGGNYGLLPISNGSCSGIQEKNVRNGFMSQLYVSIYPFSAPLDFIVSVVATPTTMSYYHAIV